MRRIRTIDTSRSMSPSGGRDSEKGRRPVEGRLHEIEEALGYLMTPDFDAAENSSRVILPSLLVSIFVISAL